MIYTYQFETKEPIVNCLDCPCGVTSTDCFYEPELSCNLGLSNISYISDRPTSCPLREITMKDGE